MWGDGAASVDCGESVYSLCVQWPGNVIIGRLIRTKMFVQCLPIVH